MIPCSCGVVGAGSCQWRCLEGVRAGVATLLLLDYDQEQMVESEGGGAGDGETS